uniref:Uncharacterized protein n=1 Tax=Noccaea caerulescens TaxID=107243 RepID=A0A1J3ILK6_NOCCA
MIDWLRVPWIMGHSYLDRFRSFHVVESLFHPLLHTGPVLDQSLFRTAWGEGSIFHSAPAADPCHSDVPRPVDKAPLLCCSSKQEMLELLNT